MSDLINRKVAIEAVDTQQKSTRTFIELIVEYPSPELCTYKEYKGKPYYSIKYVENGEKYVGYGTYKLEVLSQYLKKYFMPSAEPKKAVWIGEYDGYADGNVVIDNWYCSNCDYCYEDFEKPDWNYCPNCGAKMEASE